MLVPLHLGAVRGQLFRVTPLSIDADILLINAAVLLFDVTGQSMSVQPIFRQSLFILLMKQGIR